MRLGFARGLCALRQDDSPHEDTGRSGQQRNEADVARELAECQLSLYSFIASLVSSHADVEDIRQNTNLVLWRKLHETVEIRSVHALARSIAHIEVLRYRRRKGRSSVPLGGEALGLVAEVAEQEAELLDDRRVALQRCIGKLVEADRQLLRFHYRQGKTLKAVAELVSRSASSVRHSMSRIRRQLKKCVDLTIIAEEHP